MNATSFELNVSVTADTRFAATLREVAAHAARYAGGDDAGADRFGEAVEAVAMACLGEAVKSGGPVQVVVRRGDGPVEVLIACERRFDAAIASDPRITIEWTREGGHSMCRVAHLVSGT